MARNRMLQADDTTCEAYANCSRDARYLFDRMACFCDDGGVHPDSAKGLKMSVFPGDEDLTSADVQRMLDELVAHGLLTRFEASGVRYLFVVEWSTRQRVDKPRFRYPQPNEGTPVVDDSPPTPRHVDESSPTTLGIVDEPSASVRPELKGREGNRIEVEGKGKSADASATPLEKPGRFRPPTLEQVSLYCQQRGNQINPAKFVATYEANGWMVGKSKMKDWQATVRKWEQNDQQSPRGNGQGDAFFAGLKAFAEGGSDDQG